MNLDYDLKLPCVEEELNIKYVEGTSIPNDAGIAYYDKYKISILLTDNLAAVTNGKVLNTGKYSILFFRPDEIHFGRFSVLHHPVGDSPGDTPHSSVHRA